MDIRQGFGSVAGRIRLRLQHPFLHPKTMSGKVTLFTALGGALFGLSIVLTIFLNVSVPKVSADAVTTSVTVLNTPPQWTVDAKESVYDSATSTPTNAGDVVTWAATATDGNNDNYWLLICKTGTTTPTPHVSSAPTCAGGPQDQWAVSNVSSSSVSVSAATTTKETFPFNNEKNDWFAYICDGNVTLPQCNALLKQGVGTSGPSPFFVDHPPVFTSLSSTGNANPGSTITWSTTATTTDLIRGGDTLRLYICKTNSFTFSSTTASCPGGAWATSTLTTINPSAVYTIPIPTQDQTLAAFVFLTNNFNLAATSTLQASSSPYTVNNVAPTVTGSTITLQSISTTSPTLILAVPNATSGPFRVANIQVNDNNSCLNISSGNEIASLAVNVYRSGIGSTSCPTAVTPFGYNANNCYPSVSPLTNFSCTQDAGSCTGANDSNATFTCTFSLWYNADPTDVGSQFPSQNWVASVVATDDNGATSTLAESTGGSKVLTSFLAFAVTETSIAFGGLQPGQQNDPLSTTTTLKALGNVGVDESLYGSTMCTNWSALGGGTNPDACDTIGVDATKQIPVLNQKAGTSSVAYASTLAYALSGSTTPVSVGIHVLKTTATSTPQSKLTYWAIKIPSAITLAGSYSGQDTITAVTSAAANW